MTDWSER
jgi:hypothetical protein